MAYTYREAIKTALKYLHLDENSIEVIDNTNGRGIVCDFDGVKTVIFIYPISCKQNNKQNFFDTRDSGAKERVLTWQYACSNNLRYFCFGFNEEQERYRDYILSLESDEKSISDISFRKSELTESTGTQVNIPNDFIPSKQFERIRTPKGFYIAAIRKDYIFDYIKMFDNRPYQNKKGSSDITESQICQNEYERAAEILKKHLSTKDIYFLTEKSDVERAREEFLDRFAPDKLALLSGDNLLTTIFYTQGDNTESLCCWIEMNKDCRKHFGSISGGSAYKFGLFQKQDNGKWVTGGPLKSKELSYEEALERGTQIRDALVKGADIINNALLETVEDYERLDDMLQEGVNGQNIYYNWAWFHKYYSILYPEKLSSYHSNEWQYHVLRALRIVPSEKYYARSGQISMVQKYGGWWYRQLADICFDKFGGIKQFLRLGSTDGSKGYASEWKKESIVAIGWSGLGPLEEYKDEDGSMDKNAIMTRLQEIYYHNDSKTASRKAGELIRFYESNKDSVFVVADGERLIGLVDDLGTYRYDDSSDMAHVKPGKWHCLFRDEEKMPEKSEGLLTSCVQLKNESNITYLYEKYYYGNEETSVPIENLEENEKMKNCLEIEREPRTNRLFPLNVIIYGAPGTGKTYSTAEYAIAIIENRDVDLSKKSAEERKAVMAKYKNLVKQGRIVFTTFHQSYGYEEFIQGLRPDTSSEKMSFKTVDGVFKRIADVALNDFDNNYVIIIDEINRANISKVFGELITLIEEDKRWGEINETSVTLQSGDVFAVPNNLYIVGTMNSADKSISLIDAALRRRFDFVEQKPEPDLIDDPKLRTILAKMNSKLADELDSSDLLIGHSYFMNNDEETLPSVLNNNIIPLLYEYFYDNKKKVASVLDYSVGDTNIEIIDDKMGRLSVKKKED